MIRVKNILILSGLVAGSAWAHQDQNNINHWHNNDNGGGQETSIYVEEYPDGTTYVNQDGHRYVWPAKGGRLDCDGAMASCAEALREGKASGEPTKTKLSQEGDSRSARTINQIAGGNKRLAEALRLLSRKR
ncbi:MAG: hypothetical protein H6993_04060 [Pseudomonadales bacterium]|nr:hypothetical protein [Pseudomonadales bacterium]